MSICGSAEAAAGADAVGLGAPSTAAAPSTRRANVLNSSDSNTAISFSASGSCTRMASKSASTGTSKAMVANRLESKACSRKFSRFSFCLPLSSSVESNSVSIDPYLDKSLAAVLGPIPGTPGMLSALSPMRPNRSMTCSVRSIPNRSQTSAGPQMSGGLPDRPGRNMRTFSVTSWP